MRYILICLTLLFTACAPTQKEPAKARTFICVNIFFPIQPIEASTEDPRVALSADGSHITFTVAGGSFSIPVGLCVETFPNKAGQ